MKKISYVRYSPKTASAELTEQLIECYRTVFADAPWNEWLKCPVCNKYWGVKDKDLLSSWQFRHCDTKLVEFWPREVVASDLEHEITNTASCWLALEDAKNVIGFCWGDIIKTCDLEIKLRISLPIAREHSYVAYQDEVGVLPQYRRHGIAKGMVGRRLFDFIERGNAFGVVRTRETPEPSQTFLWYKRLGYRTLANYSDGRIIMGRELKGLWHLMHG